MVNPIKMSQVNKIATFIKANNNKYDKLVVFGKCLTSEVKEDDILELGVNVVDFNVEDYDFLYDLYLTVDDITDGKFDIVIINDPYVLHSVINEINKGDIIYEKG